MEKINILDESGDKKYFSQLPHYILNHSTAIDQALYWQMKRYAGENGRCYATQETLRKKMHIGKKTYLKSLEYLLSKGWIKYIGMTQGKTRPIKTYSITDIWKLNIDNYEKIGTERAVSFKEIGTESNRDRDWNGHKIGTRMDIEEDLIKEEHIKEDIPKGIVAYGDQSINSVFSFLKEKLGATPDGSQKENRQYVKLLLERFKKDYPDKDSVFLVKTLIEYGLKDNFHGKNITCFKYLFYNANKIIAAVKNKNNKKKGNSYEL